MRLNHEVVALAVLGDRLVRFGGRVVFVRGDRGLEFRQVAEGIDIALGAGLLRIALMLE